MPSRDINVEHRAAEVASAAGMTNKSKEKWTGNWAKKQAEEFQKHYEPYMGASRTRFAEAYELGRICQEAFEVLGKGQYGDWLALAVEVTDRMTRMCDTWRLWCVSSP